MPVFKARLAGLNGYHATFDPADATDYFFGSHGTAPGVVSNLHKIMVPWNGILRRAIYYMNAQTVVGSNESIAIVLRKADATDYSVNSLGLAGAMRMFSNSNMNLAVSKGDAFEFKLVGTTWATNPTGCLGQWYLYIDVYE